jgi:DNA-binding SARP family transcriptional activator/Tfp pilus assembly protein PilF
MTDMVRGLRFEVLGPLRGWLGDDELVLGWPKQQAVLVALLLRTNRLVPRPELVDAVWGGDPPPSSASLVHTYLGRLRRLLEPGREPGQAGRVLVSTSGSGYVLRLAPGQLDLEVFRAHLENARRRSAGGDLAGAVDAYDAALALWHGTPLAGVTGPLAELERARLCELRLTAVEDRAEAMLKLGRDPDLIAEVSALAAENPLRERLRALLMLALYRTGRQAEALAVFADTRRLLVEELGLEPGRRLQRLHHDILTNQDADIVDDPDRLDRGQRGIARVVPRQLPLAVRHLAGRAGELAVLTGLTEEVDGFGNTAVISVIDGAAGVGKTATAVHWAHLVADRFPDGQLYVNLRGFDPSGAPMTPAEAVRGFLDAFAVPPGRIPLGLEAQAGLYRSLLADRRVLVVLDNAATVEQVRPLLPAAPGSLVVVTSRNQLAGLVTTAGAHPLTLGLLTVAGARDLMTRHLGQARLAAEPRAVDEIIDVCSRLPLALAVVAARAAAHPGFSLAALARELRDAHSGLDAFDGGDPAADVRAAFSWSYRWLSAGSARLFRLLGLHCGPDIATPAAASLAGVPAEQVRPLLAELARAHLVEEHTHGRFAVHDLLRVYAAELVNTLDTDDERRAAVHRVLDHYLHTACAAKLLLSPHRDPIIVSPFQPGVTPDDLGDAGQAMAWFAAEHPVLLAAVGQSAAGGFDTHTWQLAWTLTAFFDRRGHWHDWVATQNLALAASQRLADLPAQALAHSGLARAHTHLRRIDEAHLHYRQALDLFGALDDRTGQADTHTSLAEVFARQARYVDALDHAQQALHLYRAAGHRAGQAAALNTVGWCYALLSDYENTLTHCQEALIQQQELGHRAAEAATWDSLGYAHHHLGHHEQATTCYQKALDLSREIGDRDGEAETLTHLGDTHHANGDPVPARRAWHEALIILDELGHPDADQVRAKLHQVGSVNLTV